VFPEEGADTSQRAGRLVHVLIVQSHSLLASALAHVVEGEADFTLSGVSNSGAGAVEAAAIDRPDVVLIDFRLPDVTGPEAARMIQSAHADAAIVFHSADESEDALMDAVDAGADGLPDQGCDRGPDRGSGAQSFAGRGAHPG